MTEQCNGLTQRGIRCRRQLVPGAHNTVDNKVYCGAHKPNRNQVRQVRQNNQQINQQNIQQKIDDMIDIDDFNEIDEMINPDEIFECACCFCETTNKDKVTCSNDHKFCTDCLVQYVTDRITAGDCKLKCLADQQCDGIISHKLLKRKLDPKLYTAFNEKEIQDSVTLAGLDDIYECPKCKVYYAVLDDVYKSMQQEPRFICQNRNCRFVSCYLCKGSFHGKTDCNYAKLDNNIRKTIEEILTRNRLRQCPKCHRGFMRIDGCCKMVCQCKTMSCYVCRAQINGYEHFHNSDAPNVHNKCLLWMNEDQIEKLSFDKSLNEIYELYKNDQTKLQGEVYTIMCELEKTSIDKINKKFDRRNYINNLNKPKIQQTQQVHNPVVIQNPIIIPGTNEKYVNNHVQIAAVGNNQQPVKKKDNCTLL